MDLQDEPWVLLRSVDGAREFHLQHQKSAIWSIFGYGVLHFPWAVCGDFNTIISTEEMNGGNPFNIRDSMPFINYIDDCMLMDAGYFANNFSWCKIHKKVSSKMWERLDRLLINNEWEELFMSTTIQHLARNRFDHCPLLIQFGDSNEDHPKYFRFLDFWLEQDGFKDIVRQAWNIHIEETACWKVQQKLKSCEQSS